LQKYYVFAIVIGKVEERTVAIRRMDSKAQDVVVLDVAIAALVDEVKAPF
jgi:hypothetical protein